MTLYRFKNILQPTQAALFDDPSRMSIVGGPNHPNPLAMTQTATQKNQQSRDDKIDQILRIVQGHDKRFTAIDTRLDGIDTRLGMHDKRFDGIDKRLDGHDKRFDGIDKKLDKHDEKFDRVIQKLLDHDRQFKMMVTKEKFRTFKDQTLKNQDVIVGSLIRLHDEFGATKLWIDRVDEQTEDNAKDIVELREMLSGTTP